MTVKNYLFNGQIINIAMLTNRDEIIILVLRNLYKKRIFRLILSLISSKLRIFSLKPLIFKLKYIGFQERNRDVTIITHAFRTLQKLWDKD